MGEIIRHIDIEQLPLEERLIQEAEKYIGYRSVKWRQDKSDRTTGRTPKHGFDCSGFITYLLEQIGYPLPEEIRYAHEYHEQFGISIPHGRHKRGDLILFTYSGNKAGHIGIMKSDTVYIHAPGEDNTFVSEQELHYSAIPTPREKGYPQRYFEDPTYFSKNRIHLINPIGFRRPR